MAARRAARRAPPGSRRVARTNFVITVDDGADVGRRARKEECAECVEARQRWHALRTCWQPLAPRRQLLRTRRLLHARDLPRVEVSLALAVVTQTRAVDVYGVQPCNHAYRIAEARPALRGLQVIERKVRVHRAVRKVHDVERRADHGRILNERNDTGHRHARARIAQRAQHTRLALDCVSCWEQLARRLLAEHESLGRVRAGAGHKQEGWIALSDVKLLQLERRCELVGVMCHKKGGESFNVDGGGHHASSCVARTAVYSCRLAPVLD